MVLNQCACAVLDEGKDPGFSHTWYNSTDSFEEVSFLASSYSLTVAVFASLLYYSYDQVTGEFVVFVDSLFPNGTTACSFLNDHGAAGVGAFPTKSPVFAEGSQIFLSFMLARASISPTYMSSPFAAFLLLLYQDD
jgi:hypothetical protein